MTRIYGRFAYSDRPRTGCWWDETCALLELPAVSQDVSCDVAIIGGGFTGLSAALHLAKAGRDAVVLEAQRIGWGASGRNGGFCCLGGGMLEDDALDARFGHAARLEFRRAEAAAVRLVSDLIDEFGADVDRHSAGETQLAHRPSDVADLERYARKVKENYGVEATVLGANELAANGFGGAFHGAVTNPIGFGLNPRKYLKHLLGAARASGARAFERSSVTEVKDGWSVKTASGTVKAQHVIIATNGYSSETVPSWLAGRYMPTQSNVLVTRPLTLAEKAAQGWTSAQMAYDTRNLLHYFRLMPDGRFLFGMRGGLLSSPRAEARARRRTRQHFERMFPAWSKVESTHAWSGLVALARHRLPFAGPIPEAERLWAGLCFHRNGVAMGTYTGHLLARAILGQPYTPVAMAQPLPRFPLGKARRALLPPVYAAMMLADR